MAVQIVGISGTPEFWQEVDKRAKRTGQTRSAVVVETLCEHWKTEGLVSNPVGRPKKHKGVKKVKGS